MKKVLLVIFFAFLLSVSAVGVFAQTGNLPGASVQEKLKELRDKRQELRVQSLQNQQQRIETRQDLKVTIATKQAETRQKIVEKIKTIFSQILNRYKAALTRLDKIADKIASRIDKLKGQGVNTSAAESALNTAETLGAKAQSAINDAQAKVDAIDATSSTVRDAVHTAVGAVQDAKKALFDYHKGLVEATGQLKAAAALREGTNEAK